MRASWRTPRRGERRLNAEGLSRRGVRRAWPRRPTRPRASPARSSLRTTRSTAPAGASPGGRSRSRSTCRGPRPWGSGSEATATARRSCSCSATRADRRAHFPVTLDFEGWRFVSFSAPGRPGVVSDRHPAPRDPPHRADGTGRRGRGVDPGRAEAARTRRRSRASRTPRRADPPAARVARAGPLRHDRRAGSRHRLARAGCRRVARSRSTAVPWSCPPAPARWRSRSRGPASYAGDLLVRTCRTWRLAE